MSTLRGHAEFTNAEADAFARIMAAKMSETTCPTHRWNQPCYACARLQRHADARRANVWALGHVGHDMTRKPIRIRSLKRRPA